MMTTSRTSENGQQTENPFKERSIDKLSDDIAASLHVIVEEGWEAYAAEEFGMDGNFLDKEDMDDKYKNKPEQLENIYKNARKIICPTRGVELWEDPKWCSTQKTGSRTSQGVERRINQGHGNFFKKRSQTRTRRTTSLHRAITASAPQGSHRRAAREGHEVAH